MNDPIAHDLVTSWVPRALALDAVVSGAMALLMSRRARWRYLAAHLLVYLPVPLVLVALAHGPIPGMDGWQRDPLYVHLGLAYMLVVLFVAAHLAVGVHLVAAKHDDRVIAATLAAAALAVYLCVLAYQPAVRDLVADEPHYLVFTQSLWLDQDLNLANDYARDPYMGFWPERLPDVHAVPTATGLFPIREPGFPLALVLPFGLDGRYGVLRALVVVGTALVVQLFLLLRDVGVPRSVAAVAVVLVAFTHPLITYTTQIFPELLVALAFVTATRLLRRGPGASVLALALASAVAGLLPWLTVRALPLGVAVLACSCFWAARSPQRGARVAAAVTPFLVCLSALALLDQAMFGDWTPGAGARLFYAAKPFVTAPTFTPQIGGFGLFIDRVFGLFRNSPEYIVALVGVIPLVTLLRRRDPIAIILGAATIPYVVAIANYFYWHADWSPAPRYLVSVLPGLVLLLALGLERVRAIGSAAVGMASVLFGMSIAFTYLFLAHPSLMYNWGTFEEATAWSPGALGLFLGRWLHVDPGALYPSLWWTDAWTVVATAAWLLLSAALIAAGRGRPRATGAAAAGLPAARAERRAVPRRTTTATIRRNGRAPSGTP